MSTTLRCQRRRIARESIQAGAVVPEDLPLAVLGERELEEVGGRLGVLGVVVRVVGREDERVGAAALDRGERRVLVALDGDEGLPEEVLARALRHRGVLVAPG